MRPLLATVLLSVSILPAQVHRTAHPQDTVQYTSGNITPFGCLSASAFTEARSQILIRGFELPAPGAILVGIEVHSQQNVTMNYAALDIRVSPSNATQLGSNFISNLPSPVPVLQATNLAIAYTSGGFTQIPLPLPYVHDGSSGIVLDIQKVVDPALAAFATMSSVGNPMRADLPMMVYAYGGPSSGAAQSTSALAFAQPLAVRLQWINVPTIRLLADRSPSTNNQFGLGTTIYHTLEDKAGSVFANVMGVSFLPQFQAVPGLLGEMRISGYTMDVGVMSSLMRSTRLVQVPQTAALAGVHFCYQSGSYDPTTGQLVVTNAVDHFLNP